MQEVIGASHPIGNPYASSLPICQSELRQGYRNGFTATWPRAVNGSRADLSITSTLHLCTILHRVA